MKFQKVRGTVDLFDLSIEKRQDIISKIKEVTNVFNLKEIQTPIIEHSEVFVRTVGELSDIVKKEMYSFEDLGQRQITLRPEGTAPVIRSIVENKMYAVEKLPLKLFYLGPMFRYERPQSGRQRQFTQFGVEYIYENNIYVEVENIILANSILSKFINSKLYEVQINFLGDSNTINNYKNEITKKLKNNSSKLCETCQQRLEKNALRILDCKIDSENIIVKELPKIESFYTNEEKIYFEKFQNILLNNNIKFKINPKLVRGLDYYTGVVFEFVEYKNNNAQNTILAGGKYENLMKEFDGPDLKGIGFAIGIERLEGLIEYSNSKKEIDLFIVSLSEKSNDYVTSLINNLRIQNISCDTDYYNSKIKKQFTLAENSNSKYILIVGEEELRTGELKIKNQKNLKQTDIKIENIAKFIKEGK